MSKNFTVLSLVSLMAFTTACSDNKVNKSPSKTPTTVEASKLIDAGQNEQGAELYSRMGEILLTKPEGVLYAETMFAKSLEAYSFNNKANLYSAILAPAMTLKGYVPRLKELAKNDDAAKESMKQMEDQIRATQIKEFIDFALVMPKDKKVMKKVDDVRKFIREEFAMELKNSLAKLERVKGDTVLNYNRDSLVKKSTPACSHNENIDSCVEKISLTTEERLMKIDSYDVKALKIMFKTQRSALLIASSIGLDGYEKLAEMGEKDLLRTDKELVTAIQSIPELLKIEGSKDDLKEIFDHSEDVMNDLIDFSKISKELCSAESRGQNAFSSICVSESAVVRINELLLFVAGPKPLFLGYNEAGEEVEVEVDLRALINSNVSSLQELLPKTFDANGKAIDLKDPTLSGVIPNGDLLSKLKTVVKSI